MKNEIIAPVAKQIWEWRIKQEPSINGSEENDWELAKVYLYEYERTTINEFCEAMFLNKHKRLRPLIGGY